MDVEQIARVAHEINTAFCQAYGDNSQVDWNEAPKWQKDSAIDGVKFHQANPFAGPQASHKNWMVGKLADGWSYGAVKDETLKTHPCIKPFGMLPVEQQAKDYLFRAVVHALSEELPAKNKEDDMEQNKVVMVAKFQVGRADEVGSDAFEVNMHAVGREGVYPADGSDEDNTFAKYTPSADLRMFIANLSLKDKLTVGKKFKVYFVEAG